MQINAYLHARSPSSRLQDLQKTLNPKPQIIFSNFVKKNSK